MIEFNINHYVWVRLTPYGRKQLKQNHDNFLRETGLDFEYDLPKEDKDGWSKWQMWSLMQQLGPYISMTSMPFETTIKFQLTQ